MSDALEEYDGTVSLSERTLASLRFADDIDTLAEEQQELEALVKSLDKTCTKYRKGQTYDKQRQWHPEEDHG